ncbi:MAG: hypothetical protein E7K65_09660, partial [Pseudomonas sp.]|nr:hypothetical protein [Pseudomonas sp.]
ACDAHQGQDQPCGYSKKPVQLEQGFLKHDGRLARSMNCVTAHYAVTALFTRKCPGHGWVGALVVAVGWPTVACALRSGSW